MESAYCGLTGSYVAFRAVVFKEKSERILCPLWCLKPFECINSLLGSGIFSCNVIILWVKWRTSLFLFVLERALCHACLLPWITHLPVCELKGSKCTTPPRKAFTLRNTPIPDDVMFLYSP